MQDEPQQEAPVRRKRKTRLGRPPKKRKYTRRAGRQAKSSSLSGLITKRVNDALKRERRAMKAEVKRLVEKQVAKALKAAFR